MSTTTPPASVHSEQKGTFTPSVRETNSSNGSAPTKHHDSPSPGHPTKPHTGLELDDYFSGPRDMQKHSKLPFFMRIHGSVMPKMILPLTFVGAWATAITCIHQFAHKLSVDTVLLTVLGFVVAFGLSFRCSTAYERYNDGRKYWAQLTLTSRNLGRLIWLNVSEREDNLKRDLLAKLSAINLINAFAVALKHRLRFEPAVDYPDLSYLVNHLDGATARSADQTKLRHRKPSALKDFGDRLGLTFCQSNPRKLIKRSPDNLGNLPQEILTHLSAYINAEINDNKTVPTACCQNLLYTDVRIMADILTGVERVLNTPLPLAYSISISQITWAYIMILPFQLLSKLDWITIPATMVAAYIILGLAIIGREIENPFGNDVNDLPLEAFCNEIAGDLDILTSTPAEEYKNFTRNLENRPLFPLSYDRVSEWESHSIESIRTALKAKATTKLGVVQEERMRADMVDIEAA